MVCVRACGRAQGTRVMHVCRCARVSLERWGYKVRGNPGGWQVRCLQLGREAGGPERAGRPLGWRLRAPRGECPPPPRGCCHPPTGRGPHHARAPASYPGLGEGSGQTHRLGVTGPRLRTDTRGGGGGDDQEGRADTGEGVSGGTWETQHEVHAEGGVRASRAEGSGSWKRSVVPET